MEFCTVELDIRKSMKQKKATNTDFELLAKAQQALKEAVAGAIEDHRRTGDPIVVWKDGKVVKVHPGQLGVQESHAEYTVKKQKGRGPGKHS